MVQHRDPEPHSLRPPSPVPDCFTHRDWDVLLVWVPVIDPGPHDDPDPLTGNPVLPDLQREPLVPQPQPHCDPHPLRLHALRLRDSDRVPHPQQHRQPPSDPLRDLEPHSQPALQVPVTVGLVVHAHPHPHLHPHLQLGRDGHGHRLRQRTGVHDPDIHRVVHPHPHPLPHRTPVAVRDPQRVPNRQPERGAVPDRDSVPVRHGDRHPQPLADGHGDPHRQLHLLPLRHRQPGLLALQHPQPQSLPKPLRFDVRVPGGQPELQYHRVGHLH
mmetsp:Transcript_100237/g.173174  ORF Transcript_100237/g.173174 Transcript_100237/m.173174 type:complete len:271 (-) Transcript_100237:278-1090(-)